MTKKILRSANILAVFLIAAIAGQGKLEPKEAVKQEIRTISYNRNSLNDENVFGEFDDHKIISDADGIRIKADKSFDADSLNELDLISLEDNFEDFRVSYEANYVKSKDTLFLSASIKDKDDTPIIDSIPGLVSFNSKGEADVLFSVNNELIWLSDFADLNDADNVCFFGDLIKNLTNALIKGASTIVKILEPIIRPAVKISHFLAVKLIGNDNATKWGATILNMKADSEGIYHAGFDCWQQYFGYSDLYDVVFDSATSMRFGKYDFDVDGDNYTDYVLWAWKGNYLNLGAGAELGIYERWEYSDEIWKVNKNNAMKMTVKLEHKSKGTLFDWKPADKQWWITGFDPKAQDVDRDDLKATFTAEFTDPHWYECFKNKWEDSRSKWDFSVYLMPRLTL